MGRLGGSRMNIIDAVKEAKNGNKIRRKNYHAVYQYVTTYNIKDKSTYGNLQLYNSDGGWRITNEIISNRLPLSIDELNADDWEVVE